MREEEKKTSQDNFQTFFSIMQEFNFCYLANNKILKQNLTKKKKAKLQKYVCVIDDILSDSSISFMLATKYTCT